MASIWDDRNTDLLLSNLKGKEHIYNRNHPKYKTYNVIKECANLGKLFKPTKTGKEVLDKITSIRNNLVKTKKFIDDGCTNFSLSHDFEKYQFMYMSLFGELPESLFIRKIKKEDDCDEEYDELTKKIKFDNVSQDDSVEEIKVESYFIHEVDSNAEVQNLQSADKNDETSLIINCKEIHKNFLGKECEHDFCVETQNKIVKNVNHLKQKYNTNDDGRILSNKTAFSKGELLGLIIQFISDKPFLWDSQHPSYSNVTYKKQVLENFRKTLNPPLPVNLIQNRIAYLRKQFFKALNGDMHSWHLFNNCKFFLTSNGNDVKKYEYKDEEKNSNASLYKIIQFIKDKPYLYNSNHHKYNDLQFKKNILIDFGHTFDPPLSSISLKKRINYLKLKYFKYLKKTNKPTSWRWFKQCDFFLEESNKYFNTNKSARQDSKTEAKQLHMSVSGNNLTEPILEKYEENKIFILEENCTEISANEIGIQCNLYEELFEEKLKSTELKDCCCFEQITRIIKSFKPIDTISDIQLTFKFPDITEFSEIDNSIIDSKIPNRPELPKLIEEVSTKKFELEEYSTDSSDYGLTELPFPEKPKTSTKKTVDKYNCNQCPKKFNTNKLLDKHYTHCHAQRSLLCSKCGKVNLSFRMMQMHENTCNPDENRFCYECNQIFKSKLIYHDHFNLVHDRKNPYICACGRSFMKYTKLVLHLNTYHCGTISSCTLPDYVSKEFLETFIESKNIDDNINMDNGEKKLKFWCRICKTNSYNNRSYMAHFDREFHSNAEKLWLEEFNVEGPFECEICEHNKSVFVKISELVKHRHKHHHKCSVAAYFEKFEFAADGEQILITEPKDYSNINSLCHICKNYFSMAEFQKHFKNFEHTNLEKKWLEKYEITDFECSTCSLKYKSLSEFLIHRKSEHDEWPINRFLKSIEGEPSEIIPEYLNERINSKLIYKCSICNYYCSYKRNYIDHMLHHLPEKYIQCSCGEKFITRVKLLVHQKKRGCSKKGCKIPRFIPQIDSTINLNLI